MLRTDQLDAALDDHGDQSGPAAGARALRGDGRRDGEEKGDAALHRLEDLLDRRRHAGSNDSRMGVRRLTRPAIDLLRDLLRNRPSRLLVVARVLDFHKHCGISAPASDDERTHADGPEPVTLELQREAVLRDIEAAIEALAGDAELHVAANEIVWRVGRSGEDGRRTAVGIVGRGLVARAA